MKKIINFIIVLAILFLVFQFGITFFKNKHTVEYNLKVNNEEVKIHEEYYKDKESDYYFFRLNIGDDVFVFDVDNSFNKQKKVISDIRLYKKDELVCISPIYIKNNNDAQIFCNVDNQQYSYTSIKDKYNLNEFIDTLDNFDASKYESNDNTNSSLGNSWVYKDNMYSNEILIIYEYNDLLKITKPSNERIDFADYDIYNNELGILVDKYYILPTFEDRPEYRGFTIINILNEEKEYLYFDNATSTNLYINGVVDNKLYLFDKSNLVQYEIDPEEKTYRITGNNSTGAQYYDGEWTTRNIYDFSRQELTFSKKFPLKDNYVEAFESDKYYYYYNSNNEFYKVYKKDLDNRIYLFKFDDMKEVNVVNNYIYFINNTTLYRYDDTGIKKLLTNKEFQYNYNNIYSAYFE